MPLPPIDPTIPPNAAPSKEGAARIRDLTDSIIERMDQVLGVAGAFEDDPIIDGIILKDTATIVSELDDKAVISGMASNNIVLGNTATTIKDSGINIAAFTTAGTVPATPAIAIQNYFTGTIPRSGRALVIIDIAMNGTPTSATNYFFQLKVGSTVVASINWYGKSAATAQIYGQLIALVTLISGADLNLLCLLGVDGGGGADLTHTITSTLRYQYLS